MPSKSLWKLTTECKHIVWLIEEAYFFTITNTPRNILCYWTWCLPKDHENSEWNANELCGPSENRSFLALSTPLEIIHYFSLDTVQKTTRAEKYVNELSGSLRNDTLEQDQHHYSTRDNLFFLDLMPSKRLWKLKRMWTNCLAHRRSVVF